MSKDDETIIQYPILKGKIEKFFLIIVRELCWNYAKSF